MMNGKNAGGVARHVLGENHIPPTRFKESTVIYNARERKSGGGRDKQITGDGPGAACAWIDSRSWLGSIL